MPQFLLALLLALALPSFAQQGIPKGHVFKDLEPTNTITKSYPDSTVNFHVKLIDDEISVDHHRMYYWFYQGELKCTQGNYAGKVLHGSMEKFDRKGNLLAKGEFANGLKNGPWISYYTNGMIATRYNWQHGWRTGTFETFHPNGAMLRTGKYRQNKIHGTVEVFAADGTRISKEKYRDGKLVAKKIKKVKTKKTESTDSTAVKPKPKEKKKSRKKDAEVQPSQTVDPQAPPVEQPADTSKPKKERRKKKKADAPATPPENSGQSNP